MITLKQKKLVFPKSHLKLRLSPRMIHGIDLAGKLAAPIGMVVVLLVAAIIAPSFYAPTSLKSVLIQIAVLGIVGTGQTLVLLVRSVDLSVSAVMALGAVIVVQTQAGSSIYVTLLEALVIALLVGLANGILITKRRVPPFVATFGMMWFIQGARLAYTNGQASGTVPPLLRAISISTVGGIPAALIVYLFGVAIVFFVIRFTRFGRWIYAVGGNPSAAQYSGIRVDVVRISIHMVCSVLSLLGGLVLSGYIGYVDLNIGTGYNLNSLAAAVIGGTMFSGGEGNIFGTAAGAILMISILNLLVVLGVSIYWQFVVQGLVLIAATILQGFRQFVLSR